MFTGDYLDWINWGRTISPLLVASFPGWDPVSTEGTWAVPCICWSLLHDCRCDNSSDFKLLLLLLHHHKGLYPWTRPEYTLPPWSCFSQEYFSTARRNWDTHLTQQLTCSHGVPTASQQLDFICIALPFPILGHLLWLKAQLFLKCSVSSKRIF